MTERPPGDPRALLEMWMRWEQGETLPGKVMSELKIGGLRELLEALAARVPASGDEPGEPGAA